MGPNVTCASASAIAIVLAGGGVGGSEEGMSFAG